MYNLEEPFVSYMIGLLQTDGHHHQGKGNKGTLIIEISEKDKDILIKMSYYLTINFSILERERTSNFTNGNKVKLVRLSICGKDFRDWIKPYVPVGKKSKIIRKPTEKMSDKDYWRGIIDGDGSVGVTVKGIPFVSLVTDSDELAKDFCNYIKEITGIDKKINRNKRDNIYQLMVQWENAQKIIKELYYTDCIAMNRKMDKAQEALKWVRPLSIKKKPHNNTKWWTKEQDNFILNNSIESSMVELKRSKQSVSMRLWRLKKHQL